MNNLINALLFLAFSNLAIGSQGPAIWKVQGVWGEKSIFSQCFKTYVVTPVNEELKGHFRFEFYPQNSKSEQERGAIAPIETNKGSFSAVRRGQSIAGMMQTPIYWGGADPLFPVIGDLVAAWEQPQDFNEWLEKSGIQLLQGAYNKHDLQFIGYTISPPESLVSISPIRHIADLNGRIARAPRGLVSDFFKEMNVLPRSLEANEVKYAFNKKLISLADYSSLQTNLSAGLYDVATHTNYPGFHSMAMVDFVVNRKMWDELPVADQRVINKHVQHWGKACHEDAVKENKASIKIIKDMGVTLHRWTKADLKEARIVASRVWDDYAQKHKSSRGAIESIKEWLRKKGQL